MRFNWNKPNVTTASAASPQFLVQDFLKLVAYAVASGVAFSALAIGVTLAVSRDSEAQTAAAQWVAQDGMFVLATERAKAADDDVAAVATHDDAEFAPTPTPTPGSLYIGDGCGAEELPAIEREWYVSIDGGMATVQVMQTFVLPEAGERSTTESDSELSSHEARDPDNTAPSFSALLPNGAAFLSMTVDTSRTRLNAKAAAVDENDDQDYETAQRTMREVQSRGDLPVYINQSANTVFISSAPVLDFRAGETIVVTYRYRIAIEHDNGRAKLALPLQAASEYVADGDASIDSVANTATGTVWVEWNNAKTAPRVFDALPRGATIEQIRGGIAGLSWATERIAPGEKFVLGWR